MGKNASGEIFTRSYIAPETQKFRSSPMLITEDRYEGAPVPAHRFVVPDRLPPLWNGERCGEHPALAARFAAAAGGFAKAEEARHVVLSPTPAPVPSGVWVLRDLFGRR
jgi:hypothetical protein